MFDALNQLDWVIICVLFVSTILGGWRGVVSEVVSIAGWIVGIILAIGFSADLGAMLPIDSFGTVGRTLAGAVVIIIATLMAFAVIGAVLRHLIRALTGGIGDNLLGLLFGVLRGSLIVLICVFIASFTSAPESKVWRTSVLMPAAEKALTYLRPLMPESLVAVEELAEKQREAAKEAWNSKFKLF